MTTPHSQAPYRLAYGTQDGKEYWTVAREDTIIYDCQFTRADAVVAVGLLNARGMMTLPRLREAIRAWRAGR